MGGPRGVRSFDLEGDRHPVVLEIHGGPSSMWGPGELTMWHELQLLASWGYGVVYSNVAQRGVYDLSFFFGEGNAWLLVPFHFGGYPWEAEAREVLNANSP